MYIKLNDVTLCCSSYDYLYSANYLVEMMAINRANFCELV